MREHRDLSPFAKAQSVSTKTVEAAAALLRVAEGWITQPFPPVPAEIHEVTRGLAQATEALAQACEFLAGTAGDGATGEDEAITAYTTSAAGLLRDASDLLNRVGVLRTEQHLGLEEWADPPVS